MSKTTPRRAVSVIATRSALGGTYGQPTANYALCLDGGTFQWTLNDSSTADGRCVIAATGGSPGRYKRLREDVQGAALTDADATLQVGDGFWRRMPAATLGANRTLTLGTTNAVAGDTLTITREDVGAFTLAVVNGGPGAGTLLTFPVSEKWWADFYFNGTNWVARSAGRFPT